MPSKDTLYLADCSAESFSFIELQEQDGRATVARYDERYAFLQDKVSGAGPMTEAPQADSTVFCQASLPIQAVPAPSDAPSAEAIEALFKAPAADWAVGVFTLDFSGAAGAPARYLIGVRRDDLAAVRAGLQTHGWSPASITPRILPAMGSLVSEQGSALRKASCLVLEVSEGSTELYLLGVDVLRHLGTVSYGFDAHFQTLQGELGLRFAGSAAKLFAEKSYDFSDQLDALLGPWSQQLKAELGTVQPAPTPPSAFLHVVGMPTHRQEFIQELAQQLGLHALGHDGAQENLAFSAEADTSTRARPGLSYQASRIFSAREGDAQWFHDFLAAPRDWAQALVVPPKAPEPQPAKAAPAPAPQAPARLASTAPEPASGGPGWLLWAGIAAGVVLAIGVVLFVVLGGSEEPPVEVVTTGPYAAAQTARAGETAAPQAPAAVAEVAAPATRDVAPPAAPDPEPVAPTFEPTAPEAALAATPDVAVETAEAALPEAAPAPVVQVLPASLTVESLPSGAAITVRALDATDGDAAAIESLETPATLEALSPGTYALEASMPGYASRSVEVSLWEGEERRQVISLQPLWSRVAITTEPEGVTVILERTSRASAPPGSLNRDDAPAPATFANVAAGDYQVTLRRAGWPDVLASLTVVEGEDLSWAYTFRTASLTLTSEPSGAAVIDADKKLLGTTPVTLDGLVPTAHTLRLVLPGYEDGAVYAELAEGQSDERFVQLERWDRIMGIEEVDRFPRALDKPTLIIPRRLKAEGGTVELIATVEVDGSLSDMRVRDSSNEAFNNLVLAYAARLTFAPAERKGRAVRARVVLPISFTASAAPEGEED